MTFLLAAYLLIKNIWVFGHSESRLITAAGHNKVSLSSISYRLQELISPCYTYCSLISENHYVHLETHPEWDVVCTEMDVKTVMENNKVHYTHHVFIDLLSFKLIKWRLLDSGEWKLSGRRSCRFLWSVLWLNTSMKGAATKNLL